MNTTKLIILNIDGVILNRELALSSTISSILKDRFEIRISPVEYLHNYLYRSDENVLQRLKAKAPKVKDEIDMEEILTQAHSTYSQHLGITENIERVLKMLKQNGLIVAGYLSSTEKDLKEILHANEIKDHISHFIFSDEHGSLIDSINHFCKSINIVTNNVTIVSNNADDIQNIKDFNMNCIRYSKNSNAFVKFANTGAGKDLKIIDKLPLVV